MKFIQVVVPDELHQRLKKVCVDENVPLNQKVVTIIEEEVERKEECNVDCKR